MSNELFALVSQSIGGETQQTVTGRELHAALEIKKDYSDWAKAQIERAGFVESVDYVKTQDLSSPKKGSAKSRAQVRIEYHFTISAAKEIAMMSGSPKGKEVRLYFIECEKRLKETRQQMALAIPQTLPEALRLAADLAEKNQQLIEQAKIDTPKAEWCDRVTAANEHMTITQAAKTLNYPPRKFKDYLRQIGFIYANSDTPMQEHIKAGRAVLRYAHYTTSDGHAVEKPYTHITSKGLKWLYERMVRDGLIEQQQDLFDKTA